MVCTRGTEERGEVGDCGAVVRRMGWMVGETGLCTGWVKGVRVWGRGKNCN